MSSKLLAMYDLAEQEGIDVDWIALDQADSLSLELPDGTYCIAMNPWKMPGMSKELVMLSHELGHCMTGSFYNPAVPLDILRKHENRADKWAIRELIPEEALAAAVSEGCTELWDLADYFGVTEDFMRKALCWYRHGNLAVEEYM